MISYKIRYYVDRKGDIPVKSYLDALLRGQSRGQLRQRKFRQYLSILESAGLAAGEPYIKSIENIVDLWELRPASDCVLFVYVSGDTFVLLHAFEKKSQKTPISEIKKPCGKLRISRKGMIPLTALKGTLSREDVQEQLIDEGLVTREDILEDQFIGETIATLLAARRQEELSQNDLARISGVKQPIISRFERGGTDPRVSTLIRLLAPFGKTLAVVPIASGTSAKKRQPLVAM